MESIYDRIITLCTSKGVSPNKMCTDIGISRSTVTGLKTGRVKGMLPSTAKKIGDYFNVAPDFVIYGDTPRNSYVKEEIANYNGVITPDVSVYKENDSFDEVMDYLQTLRDRPEMKMLFKTAKTANKESIEKIVELLEALDGKDADTGD